MASDLIPADTSGSRYEAGTASMSDGSSAAPGRLIWLLAAVTFLVFFQAFMVAPLIPRLAFVFGSGTGTVSLAVPAFLIPYGVMTLVWGPLADRVGRGRRMPMSTTSPLARVDAVRAGPVILASLGAFVVLTAGTAAVSTAAMFVVARMVTAVGASGVVPIALAMIGDQVDYAARGRALGTFFGAMAGGIAFGSSAGALVEPVIGWRGLFLGVSALTAVGLAALVHQYRLLGRRRPGSAARPGIVAGNYVRLLEDGRARRTYGYVLLNAVLHSGIYTWLGLYLGGRYGLGEVGIGLALLGYGIPGFLLGPVIGRLADHHGRARLIPAGVAVAAVSALVLAPHLPLAVPVVTVAVLSLGYDLTQPLLAGIVTSLPGPRGRAMGLNVFTLFVGFGLGNLAFQGLLHLGFLTALAVFGAAGLAAAAVAVPLFATETAGGR